MTRERGVATVRRNAQSGSDPDCTSDAVVARLALAVLHDAVEERPRQHPEHPADQRHRPGQHVEALAPLDRARDEPRRVAESVATMGLRYATVTGVTRDDLPDEGAWLYAETVRAIHRVNPGTGVSPDDIRLKLDEHNIECRPLWKPMHLQPVFSSREERAGSTERNHAARVVGGRVAEDLFNRGLCLPSGTAMTDSDLDRIISIIRRRPR